MSSSTRTHLHAVDVGCEGEQPGHGERQWAQVVLGEVERHGAVRREVVRSVEQGVSKVSS
jgi:hypothetical protein